MFSFQIREKADKQILQRWSNAFYYTNLLPSHKTQLEISGCSHIKPSVCILTNSLFHGLHPQWIKIATTTLHTDVKIETIISGATGGDIFLFYCLLLYFSSLYSFSLYMFSMIFLYKKKKNQIHPSFLLQPNCFKINLPHIYNGHSVLFHFNLPQGDLLTPTTVTLHKRQVITTWCGFWACPEKGQELLSMILLT